MKISAIIAAGGAGKRMGLEEEKPYLFLGDKPILVHTLINIAQSQLINEIIVVASKNNIEKIQELVNSYNIKKIVKIVAGGAERTISVYNGILNVSADMDFVLIHDGVRPFIQNRYIEELLDAAKDYDGAIVGVKVKPTIKEVNPQNLIISTLDRSKLWEIQTPQMFKKEIILEAYTNAMDKQLLATDDAALVEELGGKVKIVEGSYNNIKITTQEDLVIAEAILKNQERRYEER